MKMLCRIIALVLGMSVSLGVYADSWQGEYIFVPNERMPQLYDDQGNEKTMVTVIQLEEGMGMQIDFSSSETMPVKLETDGKTLRDWLGGNSSNIQSQALIGDRVALIHIAKGSTLELKNGRTHTMRSDYLLLMPEVDLELEKKPSTP
ncbi:hypothetical protein NH8B_1124 [Pseudogulbenkiania sp. NH8B]|uniref:hypothetical protein n=1 Tax=Pseudogulbenkiania sp. (strain NH8B) TaxID=748280 RepID=UPI0002279C81|nr:hypothetical protein [Pseudogulbenkiania sp. NH8B]BAK75954.1 hypothetical protein NH8B_1124 [Pseudogulbenkiania sp. NH8B]